MKIVLTALQALTAFLLLATTAHGGGPPDFLATDCVDASNRQEVRWLRLVCDEVAEGLGYSAGISRPWIEAVDGPESLCQCGPFGCGNDRYSCLGVPGGRDDCETYVCPDG